MSYTTNELISGAYYASGVVAREFETVTGAQIADGLQYLNDILAEKTIDQGMIPYETTYEFNTVIDQEEYEIDNLVMIDTITYTKDNVRYPMRFVNRDEYFSTARINSISSLPFIWYAEKQLGGSKLYLYFEPDQAYPVTIHGIFRLSAVTLNQDLEPTTDQFYRTYLRYALADRICTERNFDTPIGVSKQLSKYEHMISKNSRPLDLRMQKKSTFSGKGMDIWVYASLYRGWTP